MAPSVEVATPQPQEEKKNVIGFIYPPPEVRNIVDKTASFVARNGVEFESRIRQNEQNNPKFNFLNPGDPYHAYYQHKVEECREGKPPASKDGPTHGTVSAAQQQKQQELLRSVVESSSVVPQKTVPKEAPPDYEFIADPPSISAYDLDVVRLTAQFVARNGRHFLTTLLNREQRNSQFDFLRPQHSLFQFFTKLLEQYTKVLIPPKDLMKRLAKEAQSSTHVLKQANDRVEWDRYVAAQKRKEEEAIERERQEYAAIDWHGFSVVETIDYQPWEAGTFPPPTTPSEVGRRVLAQDRLDEGLPPPENEMVLSDDEQQAPGERDDTQVQDMDEASSSSSDESDDEGDASSSSSSDEDEPRKNASSPMPPPPPPSLKKSSLQPQPEPPKASQVIVRSYDPRQEKGKEDRNSDQFLVSPITGERIPADKVDQHLKINMLDPRWLETKRKQEKEATQQDNVFAAGDSVRSSLKQLAERRTDIFGAGEETIIGRKIGEQEKREPEKVTWDGHSKSMEAATRAARANVSIEAQIHQIHKVQGLVPDHQKEKIGPKAPSSPPPPPKSQPPPPPSNPPPPPPSARPQPPPPPAPPGNEVPGGQPMNAPPGAPPQNMIPQNMGPGGMMRMQFAGPMGPMMGPGGVMMVPRPPMMMPRPPGFMPPTPMGGFMPPRPPQMPPGMGPPMGPPGSMMPPNQEEDDEGPAAKRPRTEDILVNESEWGRRYPGVVKFKVSVPESSDKQEWKLNGQTLNAAFILAENVGALKTFIHQQTGLPSAKQKLVKDGIFFKDSVTLAYYNIGPNSTVQLQLKERGGRKK